MKCIVIYGTLSGSTMTAATVLSESLKNAGHEVSLVMADPSTKDQIKDVQSVVFASPSWEDNGVDGQPLPEVRQVIESMTAENFTGKKVAICGLGDVSYPHFCGAVDVLEGLLKDRGVTPIVESLKIDRYYSSADNEQKVKTWTAALASILSQS